MNLLQFFVNQRPGREQAGPSTRYLYIGGSEGRDYGFSANAFGEQFESIPLGMLGGQGSSPLLSGSTTASSGPWVATYDTGGTATWGVDGYTLTTATTSGNKFHIRHSRRWLSTTTQKVVTMKSQFQIDTVANSTLYIGFWNTQTDPSGTPPTNGVFFVITAGAIVARVRGASGTAADSGTLATMADATEVEVDIKWNLNGSTSWGEFWVNGTKTAMTAAQLTQLQAMTGNLFWQCALYTNTTGARNLIITSRSEGDK